MSARVAPEPWDFTPAPANDNVFGATMPDDGPFPLDLALIFAAIIVLAVYVLMCGPDDVMAVLRR